MIYKLITLILALLISTQSITNTLAGDNIPKTSFNTTSYHFNEETYKDIVTNLLAPISTFHPPTDLALSNISNKHNLIKDKKNRDLNLPTEVQSKYQQAMMEYDKGNIKSIQQKWNEALENYKRAIQICPNLIFARVNIPLIYYQFGNNLEAIKEIKYLVKKYPMSPDARAALVALLWSMGQEGEAKSHWVSVVGIDDRYKDLEWIQSKRFWPPKIIMSLDSFLNSKQ